ncbi:MAG: ABC transporter permease [Gammaproteobacteria bacterium]|nr:ABC transporter permease [Gammaproteobacteria bacterium]
MLMFSLLESLRSALASIRAHGLRSFLTTLGIIIGVASTIAVVSLMQGVSHTIGDRFASLGSDSLTIQSYTSNDDFMQGLVHRLSLRDYEQILHHIDGIHDITPVFMAQGDYGATVRNGNRSSFTRILATTPSYQELRQYYPARGRFLTKTDEQYRRRVCVIGTKLRENLKLPTDPIGQYIELGGDWFKIVGLMEERGEMFGFSQDDLVLIPFGTGLALSAPGQQPDIQISFRVRNPEEIDAIQARIGALLRQLHKLKPGQADDFKVQTADQLSESFSGIIDTMTVVLGGIVSISLLVGGIGIMNIMLVSVTERTREIGICKALGAKRRDILMQFLIEATSLSLLGGLIGLALGYGLGFLAAKLIPGFPDAHVPWWAIALAFGFSTGVGILFGLMPAAKAAKLDPIEALRYE